MGIVALVRANLRVCPISHTKCGEKQIFVLSKRANLYVCSYKNTVLGSQHDNSHSKIFCYVVALLDLLKKSQNLPICIHCVYLHLYLTYLKTMLSNYSKLALSLFFCLLLGQASFAQQDSLLLLLEKEQDTTVSLLPKRMMFTQSTLWGRKGLLRITGLAPLTEKSRTRELKLRRRMLVLHQILGYVTLGGMIGQGIVGSQLYKGNFDVLDAHKKLGLGVRV